MLWEIIARPGQDARHALQQDSVSLLNFGAAIYITKKSGKRLQHFKCSHRERLTFDHLLLFGLDDGMEHGLGQRIVHAWLHVAQHSLVLGTAILAHPRSYVPVYLWDRSVHI